MKKRCYNSAAINFDRYGGRGIYICDEWQEFAAFKAWAMSNGYDDGLFIDRIDNDGPYSPDNCRFVDRVTNNQNRRVSKWLTIGGEKMPMTVAATRFGIKYHTLKMRLASGYSDEQAVQQKVNPNEKAGAPIPRLVTQQLRRSTARSLRARALREQGPEAARRAAKN